MARVRKWTEDGKRIANYHRMTWQDKVKASQKRASQEGALLLTRCPACNIQMPEKDLAAHQATRCPGRPP